MQQNTKENLQKNIKISTADIVDLLLQGFSIPSILEYAKARGVDGRKEIAKAADYLVNVASTPPEQAIGWAMEALRDLYRRSIEIGDLANAKACVVELAKIASRKNQAKPRAPNKSTCR